MDAVCTSFSTRGRRDKNDDRALINDNVLNEISASCDVPLPVIIAVCDGCGGYKGGDVASRTALGVLAETDPSSYTDEASVHAILSVCNERISAKKREYPEFEEMCTTIAGCVISEDRVVFFNSGDTRIYRSDMRRITRMTQDHTYLAQLERSGMNIDTLGISRSVITRCLGVNGSEPADVIISEYPPVPGDSYIICSDGLWDFVDDSQIFAVMQDDTLSDEAKTRELVRMAYEAESDDNITVCICTIPGGVKPDAQESAELILD